MPRWCQGSEWEDWLETTRTHITTGSKPVVQNNTSECTRLSIDIQTHSPSTLLGLYQASRGPWYRCWWAFLTFPSSLQFGDPNTGWLRHCHSNNTATVVFLAGSSRGLLHPLHHHHKRALRWIQAKAASFFPFSPRGKTINSCVERSWDNLYGRTDRWRSKLSKDWLESCLETSRKQIYEGRTQRSERTQRIMGDVPICSV